jgi:hypothetical protein
MREPRALSAPRGVESGRDILEFPNSEAREMAMSNTQRVADPFDSAPDHPGPDVEQQPAEQFAGRHAPARGTGARMAGWIAAGAFALAAIGEGAWIARLERTRPVAAPPAPVPIVVDSPQAGDTVIVDGREVGVTPLTLALPAGVQSIRLRTRASTDESPQPQAIPAVATAGDTATAAVLAQAAARERRGGLRLSSPIELQVLEGERVLGTSTDGPVVTTAGRHELDFVNSALGYRSRRVVEIKAGQIVPMSITPPDGRVSVNAVPWAQVWINGKPVGDTPLANLPLPVGEHEIAFRHPQLGEQIQKVIVKPAALTRVSVTFQR